MPTMTKSLEDYIETIYVLIKEKGAARVRDVAADLKVKMPSVVKAMAELKKLELVTQEPYGDIELTAKGRKVATDILARHTILKAFLVRLGVTEQVADNAPLPDGGSRRWPAPCATAPWCRSWTAADAPAWCSNRRTFHRGSA